MCVPPVSALPCCDTLPLFEDVEVIDARVQAVVCKVVLVLDIVMLLIGMSRCFTLLRYS